MDTKRKIKLCNDIITLQNCTCCPRECYADRTKPPLGFCQSGITPSVASIFCHHGEEPVISGDKGICNIFFNHCNMQCIYCQNYQISDNSNKSTADNMTVDEIVKQVEAILRSGVKRVGFVSPSHFIPQMLAIIERIESDNYHPYYVYNTNGYDKVGVIRYLSDKVDIYLPDFKYMDNQLAQDYSQTPHYVEHAQRAIKEMYRQKGAEIVLDEKGLITSGLIIRHLILPHHIENSKAVLHFIASELSPDIYISLMSQYYPPLQVAHHPHLGRTLTPSEYDEVVEEFYRLGFHRGFLQELPSSSYYQPDFSRQKPFED